MRSKKVNLQFWLKKEQKDQLKSFCERRGIGMGEYVRTCLVKNGAISKIDADMDYVIAKDRKRKAKFFTPSEEYHDLSLLIANSYGVMVRDMNSDKRIKPIPEARHMFRTILFETTKMSLNEIGLKMCYADHSTVIHSVKTMQDLISVERETRRRYLNIIKVYAKLQNMEDFEPNFGYRRDKKWDL